MHPYSRIIQSLWTLLILVSVSTGIYYGYRGYTHQPVVLGTETDSVAVSALDALTASPTTTPTPDPRVSKLERYFDYRKSLNKRESPLATHSSLLVSEADRYGIDYRLVTAIATIESNQCHQTPLRDPYNCWGWGIYPGSVKEPFVDWADGIRTVTRGLARQYHRRGHDTIEEVARIYNPNTPLEWGAKVQKIYDLIDSLE